MKISYMNFIEINLEKYHCWNSILIRQKVLLKIVFELENYWLRMNRKNRESLYWKIIEKLAKTFDRELCIIKWLQYLLDDLKQNFIK